MQFLDLSLWQRAIRGLMAMLCQLVYPLISWLYDLFMNISKVNILTGELQPIYQRVTMILTIIMIFYVTFEFVKFVVQPDGITDKEKGAGNIIYKMIAVVVLIAFVPTIFTWAYKLQGAIVDKGIIGKVIIGDTNTEPDKFGKTFSAGILSLFYSVDASDIDEECGDIKCGTVVQMNLSTLSTAGQLPYLTIGINSSKEKSTSIVGEKAEMPLINFEGFMAVLVGGFVAYILVLYCIDLGVRWAQLIFLQIVAPIPIIGYLSPKKDGIFQKWCKQCLTTYLDLFIRIALIYFVLLICSVLLDARETGNLLEGLGEISPAMETFVYIALILGVMLFAQKAPKLLGELFPKMGAASGNFGFSGKQRLEPALNALKVGGRVAGGLAGTAIGATIGAASGLYQGWRRSKALNKNGIAKGTAAGIWGATRGTLRGVVGGAARGIYQGSKKGNVLKNSIAGAKQQADANKKFGNREEQGYTLAHQIGDRARNLFSIDSRVATQEAKKAPIKRHDEALKHVTDTESKIKDRALSKIKEGGAKSAEAKEAARELAAAEAELQALEDPTTAKSRFKVGKYTDTDQAKKDYDAALLLAKSSINKANFIDSNGIFDQAGYDAACKAAVSKVNADDYAVAYNTDAEATAAYNAAVTNARNSINRNSYTTQADYEAACQKAENGVHRELFIKGYATEEAAQAALGSAIDKARSDLDNAQKSAVIAYVAQEGTDADGTITTAISELDAYIKEYNKTAESTRRISEELAPRIQSNFKAFSDEIKTGSIRKAIDTNNAKTIEIDAEIDRIKRETENTGIDGGKKSS